MGYFIYDNVNTVAHGITIDGSGAFNAPERDVEMISVPGRNGDIIVDNGRYLNGELTYAAGITRDFEENSAWARSFFLSRSTTYHRLTDSYDSEHFRMARYKGGVEIDPTVLNRSGALNFVFDCKPQRFLFTGDDEQTVTNGSTISNPTMFDALPLLQIRGVTQNTILTINGKVIKFLADIANAKIDCELMDCWNGATYLNNIIQCAEFPHLSPSANSIAWSGTIAELKITPRWWEL